MPSQPSHAESGSRNSLSGMRGMSTEKKLRQSMKSLRRRNSLTGMRGMSTKVRSHLRGSVQSSQFPDGNEGYVNAGSLITFKRRLNQSQFPDGNEGYVNFAYINDMVRQRIKSQFPDGNEGYVNLRITGDTIYVLLF